MSKNIFFAFLKYQCTTTKKERGMYTLSCMNCRIEKALRPSKLTEQPHPGAIPAEGALEKRKKIKRRRMAA